MGRLASLPPKPAPRRAGDDILLVGNEAAPPYSRMAIPYLLEGNIDEAGTYLRKTAGHFEQLRIRQRRGRLLRSTLKNAQFCLRTVTLKVTTGC
jgi:hypothetical protein